MVGNVQVPLLAIGKLLRRGWQLINDGEVKLQEPFGRTTPVGFRHNSLALRGHIRAVLLEEGSVNALTEAPRSLPPSPPIIELPLELKSILGQEGMHGLAGGVKAHFKDSANRLMDGRDWCEGQLGSSREFGGLLL